MVDLRIVSKNYISGAPLHATGTQTPASLTQAPTRSNLDARLVLSELPLGSAKGTISLWGKNLLNEKDPNFFIDYGANFQNLTAAYFPDPRTYGVTLGVRF